MSEEQRQPYKGRQIYHTLKPRSHDFWSAGQNGSEGYFHERRSQSTAKRPFFTLLVSDDKVSKMVAGGATIVPTLPRRIVNVITGKPAVYNAG